MWQILLKPWVWAVGGTASAYFLAKTSKGSRDRLREAKLELIEQQRTIDRLRAEIGRERNLREQTELEITVQPKESKNEGKDEESKKPEETQ